MRLLAPFVRPLTLCLALSSTVVLIQGCVPLMIGGAAATTGIVAVDRRTVGQQVEDKTIEIKVANSIRTKFGDSVRVNITSYQGVVLVTGDSLGNDRKAEITQIASQTQSVKSVSNQVNVVKETASFGELSNDTWITSKVMTTLATTNEIPSRTIVVATDRSVVYLMGLVTQREGDLAAAAAAHPDPGRGCQRARPGERSHLHAQPGAHRRRPNGGDRQPPLVHTGQGRPHFRLRARQAVRRRPPHRVAGPL